MSTTRLLINEKKQDIKSSHADSSANSGDENDSGLSNNDLPPQVAMSTTPNFQLGWM